MFISKYLGMILTYNDVMMFDLNLPTYQIVITVESDYINFDRAQKTDLPNSNFNKSNSVYTCRLMIYDVQYLVVKYHTSCNGVAASRYIIFIIYNIIVANRQSVNIILIPVGVIIYIDILYCDVIFCNPLL